jgi:hypothetical protein
VGEELSPPLRPLRDRPYCWSSRLGLYTPGTAARGIASKLWAPRPRSSAAVACGRLPYVMRSRVVKYLGDSLVGSLYEGK